MKHVSHDIRLVHQGNNLIGECPTWNVDEQALYWVDTRDPFIHRCDAKSAIRSWKMPTGMGAFAFRKKGGLVAGMQNGFAFIDLDERTDRATVTPFHDPEPDRPDNHLNDGKCDSAGRFWCGSRDADGDKPTGSLYRLDPDLTCHRMATGIIISNCMAFSPAEPAMIYGDSTGETVWRYDFDAAKGTIANRTVFHDTRHLPWRVDGANFDSEGYYWGALVYDWSIGRFAPDGKLNRLVRLPTRFPTMCCFGGPDLDILYVTTASTFLDDKGKQEQPWAGAVLSIHGLGVRGLPPERFAG
jgi:sugar lactone lactonase YvrE